MSRSSEDLPVFLTRDILKRCTSFEARFMLWGLKTDTSTSNCLTLENVFSNPLFLKWMTFKVKVINMQNSYGNI